MPPELTNAERGLGCHPDDPRHDHVDRVYGAPAPALRPRVTKNRDRYQPPILDQRRSNACVAFSGDVALMCAEFRVTGKPPPQYSPLFGWYNARQKIGAEGSNSGCTIRDYAECARTFGVCSEDRDPFSLATPDDYLQRLSQRPDPIAYEEAARHQTLDSYTFSDGDFEGVADAVAADGDTGHAVQTSFPVYASFFDTPSSGVSDMWRGSFAGWHAVCALDLDVVSGVDGVWIQNSWGTTFGRGGLFFVSVADYAKFADARVYSKLEVLS